jgi:uncharacterized protein YbjT (DUF2867 family)
MTPITNNVLYSDDGDALNAVNVVLGASGGLGRAVLKQLTLRNAQVRAVSRTAPNWSTAMSAVSDVRWAGADLEDPKAAITACEGASTVYFAAQPPYGEWPERFPGHDHKRH